MRGAARRRTYERQLDVQSGCAGVARADQFEIESSPLMAFRPLRLNAIQGLDSISNWSTLSVLPAGAYVI